MNRPIKHKQNIISITSISLNLQMKN